MKSIEAPTAIDLRLRETAAGVARSKNNSLRAPTAPPADASAPATPEEVPEAPPPTAGPSLRFSVDQESGRNVVALVDPVDGKVLRQIPSEEAIAVAEAIGRF